MPELFSGLTFTTAKVVHITAMITFIHKHLIIIRSLKNLSVEILWKFLTARHFVYFRTYLVAGHLQTAYSETRKSDSYSQNVLLSILKSDLRVFSNIFI